jgi:hypothetical protein
MFAPKLIRFRSPALLLSSRSSDFRPLPPASVNSAPSALKSPVTLAPHTPSLRSSAFLTSFTSLFQRASNPLSFQSFTNASSPNPFPLNILQMPRGASPLPNALFHESASVSFHGTYASFVFILLRTLLHRTKRYLQSFQALPHSLDKTPGWRYPLPDKHSSSPLSSLFRTPRISRFQFRFSPLIPPPHSTWNKSPSCTSSQVRR